MRVTLDRWRRSSAVSTLLLVAGVAALAFVVQAFVVKPYRIPSGSMLPTLDVGQRVLVERVGHRLGGTPERGDVIVFHPAVGAEAQRCAVDTQGAGTAVPCAVTAKEPASDTYIKRVVGVPGDRIALRDGRVVRNGRRVDEPYVRACGPEADCTFARAITVPPGTVYVLGDNRGDSGDSRYWGPVRDAWIIGHAVGSYWPPKRIGGL